MMIVTMIIKVVMMICDNGYKGAHDDCDNADYQGGNDVSV